ncbi:MAG: hypothetical protein JWO36_1891, partial [Myxococcales bacterium]|nr:hypothetical protein [Myxococcales bacterium]
MRGAIIHGVLLAVMLVYGYRTWTRDKTVEPNVGAVVLWDRSDADIVSIEYKAPKKIVKLERKGDYWWGTDTQIETKPKETPPASTGSAGSAGSGAGSGSSALALPPPPEEIEVGRKVHEFPLGEAADKLIKSYEDARALRDLGTPNADAKKDYKLNDAKTVITITFKDGPHNFLVGGSVYGGSDRYVMDQQTNKAYVLSRDLISALEIGETSLHLLDPRGFDITKIDGVTIEAGGKSKSATRVTSGAEGQQLKTWGDSDTKKPNQTLANFIDNANNLRPTEYSPAMKVSDLTQVLKLTYKDDRGGGLGTLTLYKHEKPGVLPEGQELDPANPPAGEIEYFIMTEKTRVPALVRKDTAQRAEQDIETVFSGKQPDNAGSGAGSGAANPHGNPFGPGPRGHGDQPHDGSPPNPHGGAITPPPPGPHGGAPTGQGSGASLAPAPMTPAAGSGAAKPTPAKPADATKAAAPKPAPAATTPAAAPKPA